MVKTGGRKIRKLCKKTQKSKENREKLTKVGGNEVYSEIMGKCMNFVKIGGNRGVHPL